MALYYVSFSASYRILALRASQLVLRASQLVLRPSQKKFNFKKNFKKTDLYLQIRKKQNTTLG